MVFLLFEIINGSFTIEAEVGHGLEILLSDGVGGLLAVFGNELDILGDEFTVSAFGVDETLIFELSESALDGVGIDFGA